MPISIRSSKEELLFFSDPTCLECWIRKGNRTSLIDTTSTTSIDTCDGATNDSSTRTSIDTNPRADMVATLVLQRDENGDLHDPDGHLCNAAGQKLDAQGTAISEHDTDATGSAIHVDETARQRTLADYNNLDEYYANRSAIRLLEIKKQNFELKPQYYTLVSQISYSGLPHEHPMDHLETFEDLIAVIRMHGVPEDYLL